jgi:hypothetical protein
MSTMPPRLHQRVTWEPMTDPGEVIRDSIGGYPILPVGESWPVCAEPGCHRRLALFFQFDVEDRFGLPFEAGSTLSIFQCLEHDDPFEALDTMLPKRHDRLPDQYWNHTSYAIFFAAAGRQQQLAEREPFLGYSRLLMTPEREPQARSLEALNFKHMKVGGFPFWIQQPKRWRCSCGTAMEFVCSVPGDLQYPRVAGSPRQPNGRADSYFLFLGLSTYLFACRARCHPRAVVAVRQN